MEPKKILIGIGGIVGTFVLLLIAYYLTSKPQNEYFPELSKVESSDHVKWATESANVLVEYSDLQCPACAAYSGLIDSLENDEEFVKDIKPHVAIVYRHFPLDTIHPHARKAAYAAEAASMQGKFWEMHDLLFARQDEWAEEDNPEELFKKYAEELELDSDTFLTDSKSKAVTDKVQENYSSGLAARVQGTPSFFLNGYKVKNPTTLENFKSLLKEYINK